MFNIVIVGKKIYVEAVTRKRKPNYHHMPTTLPQSKVLASHQSPLCAIESLQTYNAAPPLNISSTPPTN